MTIERRYCTATDDWLHIDHGYSRKLFNVARCHGELPETLDRSAAFIDRGRILVHPFFFALQPSNHTELGGSVHQPAAIHPLKVLHGTFGSVWEKITRSLSFFGFRSHSNIKNLIFGKLSESKNPSDILAPPPFFSCL